jgi:hypothetical protein
MKRDAVGYSQPAIEVEEIDTTAQQDVLAVINDLGRFLACGELIGRGASAQEGAGLININLETGLTECSSSSESGKTPTNNRNGFRHSG